MLAIQYNQSAETQAYTSEVKCDPTKNRATLPPTLPIQKLTTDPQIAKIIMNQGVNERWH